MKSQRKQASRRMPAKHAASGRSATAAASARGAPGSLFRATWFRAAVLVVITLIAYFPARNGGFIWDDDVYITNNPLLTAADGLRRIWFSLDSPSQYFPLVYTSFRIEYALWGLDTTGYHWVNFLLHVGTALLVWRLLNILKVPGSWFAAAVFALHPVQVESVAWITERKNVLMGFFFLLTLLAWLKFRDGKTRDRRLMYGLALVCYALALAAKTTACTLPAAMLLILWLERERISWARVGEIVPFVSLGAAMGMVTIWWERYHIGTHGARFALGLTERVLVASRGVWFYLGKLLWPWKLSFFYPRWHIDAADVSSYLWITLGTALLVAIYLARRRLGRSVEVAAAFFVLTLSPVLGFIMLYTFRYSFVADHYQYLACIGPIALVTGSATAATRMIKHGPVVLRVAALLILSTLAVMTWRQSTMYGNVEILWRTTLERNPLSTIAYNNLGNIFQRQRLFDEATDCYQKALAIDPTEGDIEYNLAAVSLEKKQMDETIAHAKKALELDPTLTEAHYLIGNAYFGKGDYVQAIAPFEAAIRARPENALAHDNLGICLVATGKVAEGLAELNEAVRVDPASADAHYNLGYILMQVGKIEEAKAQLGQALRLNPAHEKARRQLQKLTDKSL